MRVLVIAALFIVSLFCVSSIYSEDVKEKNNVTPSTAKNEIPSDWEKINFSNAIEFYAPFDMKGGTTQGVDSRHRQYENKNFKLYLDYGAYGGYFNKKEEGYKERFEQIDGQKAKIITTNKIAAVCFYDRVGYKLTVYTSDMTGSEFETVLKIFRSIKFVPKSSKDAVQESK